jgi:hypothetical protein
MIKTGKGIKAIFVYLIGLFPILKMVYIGSLAMGMIKDNFLITPVSAFPHFNPVVHRQTYQHRCLRTFQDRFCSVINCIKNSASQRTGVEKIWIFPSLLLRALLCLPYSGPCQSKTSFSGTVRQKHLRDRTQYIKATELPSSRFS